LLCIPLITLRRHAARVGTFSVSRRVSEVRLVGNPRVPPPLSAEREEFVLPVGGQLCDDGTVAFDVDRVLDPSWIRTEDEREYVLGMARSFETLCMLCRCGLREEICDCCRECRGRGCHALREPARHAPCDFCGGRGYLPCRRSAQVPALPECVFEGPHLDTAIEQTRSRASAVLRELEMASRILARTREMVARVEAEEVEQHIVRMFITVLWRCKETVLDLWLATANRKAPPRRRYQWAGSLVKEMDECRLVVSALEKVHAHWARESGQTN
jgi:hypothetical protein